MNTKFKRTKLHVRRAAARRHLKLDRDPECVHAFYTSSFVYLRGHVSMCVFYGCFWVYSGFHLEFVFTYCTGRQKDYRAQHTLAIKVLTLKLQITPDYYYDDYYERDIFRKINWNLLYTCIHIYICIFFFT